jgi:NTE family protein
MKKLFLFISLLILNQVSLGQESVNLDKTPKVGLVLSGGGAKGLAHIGVLKVIDSLGVKIDYIGGTSMGAVIGGLYASGYSGKQLDSIFLHVDIDALLQDFTPRDSKNFYQKRNDEIYAVTLPFDGLKLGFPSALSKGMYNYNLLSRLTKHVSHIKNFNKLPIPFFCIATNIETGKEIILNKGILPQSMLASGALPTLYNPVEIEGEILIDGGVVNNYPVEEVRRLGATIIIGVDVQDVLKSREELKGATGVLTQIANYNMIEKMGNKIGQTDLYIKPDIKGFTLVSFDKGKVIIEKGVDATNNLIEDLQKIKYVQEKNNIESKNIQIKNIDSIYIKNIQINNLRNFTRSYVIGKLKFKPDSKISFSTFEKGMNNLNATQSFQSIYYDFEINEDGEKLILDLKEKKSNTFLKLGLHYDELLKSGLLINFTKNKIFAKNDVLSLDFIVGDNIRYNLNYYIDNGFYWSFGFNSRYTGFNRNVPNDFNNGVIFSDLGLNSINIDYSDFTNQAYMQTVFAQKFSIGAGIELKHLKISSETLENTRPIFENSDYFSIYSFIKYDSFDNKYFPKKGWYFNGDLKSFLYSTNYNNDFERFTIVKADFGLVKTFYKKFTLKLQADGGISIGEQSVNYFDFALGGYGFANLNNFRPFYGYDFISVIGDSYTKVSSTLDYEIHRKHHINFTGNFANIGNKIFEFVESWVSKPNFTGYGFGYGYDSLIGPLEIKHSWSPETRNHFTWISLGFGF